MNPSQRLPTPQSSACLTRPVVPCQASLFSRGLTLLLAASLLIACRAPLTTALAGPTNTAERLATPTRPAPTRTPVVALNGQAPLPLDSAPPATTGPDPLRLSFPTPRPAPASAWRPPLYPTPWALTPYDHFYFARPIAADQVNWPLADYRYGGIFFENVIHTGVDIPVGDGTPVMAAGSGKVVWAGYGLYGGGEDPKDPYGLAVAIRHDFGYQGQTLFTVYGHLSQIDVARGEYVEAGQRLGLSGETGHVTGPHLHFEVRIGSNDYFTTRNPELWLVPPQGWGVLAGRVMNGWGTPINGDLVTIIARSNGQTWSARTYGNTAINNDPYYRENLVIGDLPAGLYEIHIPFYGTDMSQEIQILPGQVNYFTFRGYDGFNLQLPPPPGADFTPEPAGVK